MTTHTTPLSPEKLTLVLFLTTALTLPMLVSCGGADSSPKGSTLTLPAPSRYAEHSTSEDFGAETTTEANNNAFPCQQCLASGRTWQPEASACTESCSIQDISCYTDICPQQEGPEPPTLFTMYGYVSLLYAQLWKDRSTLFSSMAHNHVLRATQWTGSLTYHPTDLSQCFVQFTLPVNHFENDEDFMRQYVGLEGTISEFYRSLIHEHMLSDGQLRGDVFSHITFESLECLQVEDAPNKVTIKGALTIRGQTKTVQAQATFQHVEENLHAQGSFDITHSDFGFEPYEAFWGSIKNGERIKISFNLVAKPAPEPEE